MSEQSPLPPETRVTLVDNKPESPPSLLSRLGTLLGQVAVLGGLFAALLISFGWSYAYHFAIIWHLPFVDLGVPLDQMLHFGRLVIIRNWWIIFLIAGCTAGLFYFVLRRWPGNTLPLFTVLSAALLLLWGLSDPLGKRTAQAEMQAMQDQRYRSLPAVNLVLKPGHADGIEPILREKLTGWQYCYRLVYRAPEGMWLMRPRRGVPRNPLFVNEGIIDAIHFRAPPPAGC